MPACSLGSFCRAPALSMPITSPIRTNVVKREVFHARAGSCTPAVKHQWYSHVFLDREAPTSQAEGDILGGFLSVFLYPPFDFSRTF